MKKTGDFSERIEVLLSKAEVLAAFKRAAADDYRDNNWAQDENNPCAVMLSFKDGVVSFDSVRVEGEVNAVYISPEGVKEYCEEIVKKFLAEVDSAKK